MLVWKGLEFLEPKLILLILTERWSPENARTLGAEDGSVAKMLAVQACGFEFNPQPPFKSWA